MVRAAISLVCLALASGARIKKHSRGSSSASCDSLLKLNVRGHTFGDVAFTVCNAWPSAFGEFPLDLSETSRLLNLALDDGGIYDDIKNIAANRSLDNKYCWKALSLQIGGSCQAGFKDAWLVSKIAPVCSSECSATGFGVSCGLGCASSKLTCAALLTKQVMDVTNKLNPKYVAAEKLVSSIAQAARFADFGLTVARNVVAMYQEYQPQLDKQDLIAVSIILLFQYAFEKDAEEVAITGLRSRFKAAMKAVVSKVVNLVRTVADEFDIDMAQTLNFIKGVVAEAAPEFLEKVMTVIKVYTNRKCESSARSFGTRASGRKGRKGRKGKGGR